MILFNTRVLIQPKDVYEYFLEHKDGLDSRMDIIAESDTDDFDKKSFLFLTTDFEGNRELFLSLEAPEVIVDSETCTDINDVKKTVEDFIKQLDKLQPIVLMEDVYGPFLENNICNIIFCICSLFIKLLHGILLASNILCGSCDFPILKSIFLRTIAKRHRKQ